MGGVRWHREIPVGKNTGVLKDSAVCRRPFLLHFVGIREITVENQHGKFAIGDTLFLTATDKTGDMFDESSEKGSGFFLAPYQRHTIEGSRIGSGSDFSLPFWIEHILNFLWNFAGGDEIGVIGKTWRARYHHEHPVIPVRHLARDMGKRLGPFELLQRHPRHMILRADKKIARGGLPSPCLLNDPARKLRHRGTGTEFKL